MARETPYSLLHNLPDKATGLGWFERLVRCLLEIGLRARDGRRVLLGWRVIRAVLYANARRLTPSLAERAYRSAFAEGTVLDSRFLFAHQLFSREINGLHVTPAIYTNLLQLILYVERENYIAQKSNCKTSYKEEVNINSFSQSWLVSRIVDRRRWLIREFRPPAWKYKDSRI